MILTKMGYGYGYVSVSWGYGYGSFSREVRDFLGGTVMVMGTVMVIFHAKRAIF